MVKRACWAMLSAVLAAGGLGSMALADAPAAPVSPNRIQPVPTSNEVEKAMEKAVAFLLSQKKADNFELQGNWGVPAPNTGGETALVTYALLHAGRSMDDERLGPNSAELKPVLKYLANVEQDGTYAAGITALALDFLPQNTTTRKNFANAFNFLMGTVNRNPKDSRMNGGYWYRGPESGQEALRKAQQKVQDVRQQEADAVKDQNKPLYENLQDDMKAAQKALADAQKNANKAADWPNPDSSNTQYGVLGAWAMNEFQIEIPMGHWALLDNYWRRTQMADGGWTYNPSDKKGVSTPTMSIAGLASLYITSEFLDNEIRLEPRQDIQMAKGLAKVTKDFKPDPDMYYMYGVERVGLASGLKFFDTKNWYREGASFLVKAQGQNGVWGYRSATIGTAYGLLFLARGRNAVPFNKLEYDGPWDARPRDDANLVEWMGKKYEKEFNWQVVNFRVDPEEWMDSPILMITGSHELKFSPEETAKLLKFVNMGGIIFTSSDGGGGVFDRSVRTLMKKMFPLYEARQLKRDNMLFNGELKTDPIRNPPNVVALSNGTRYLWVHTPEDMGATWQKRGYSHLDHFMFPLNLYFYASGLDMTRTKLDDSVVRAGTAAMKDKVSVSKLDLGPNPDPEPFAWDRMALIGRADLLTDIQIKTSKPQELAADKPTLTAFTGTAAFTPTSDDVSALQAYLKGGGTLLADASGGNAAFTKSFVALAQQLYPNAPLENIPLDDALLAGKIPGSAAITQVDFRKYSLTKAHARQNEMNTPRLRGIRDGKRWAVIFSEYDLTSGLLGTETWGIDGYAADSAVAIVRNALMYAKTPPG